MKPYVSILIPTYNAAPWIADTLESALAQNWPHKEIIVVDDGSTDETLTIVRQFESRGVRVFTQTNQGAAAARNRAWRESRGDWLQFLDADDLLHEDKISLQMQRAVQLGPEYAYCCRWTRFTHSLSDADHTPQTLCQDSDPLPWIELKLRDNVMMHPAAWLVSRSLAERSGPWDTSLTLDDDGEFFSRIVLTSAGVRHIDKAFSYYRSNLSDSLSGRRTAQAWSSAFRSLQLTSDRYLKMSSHDEGRSAVANAYQQLAYTIYPYELDLVQQCEEQVVSLGGSETLPGGGRIFTLIVRLFGWKLARRIQRWRAK